MALCQRVAGWCGSFRGVRWFDLVRPSVSVPCLVLWCAVVRRAASCPVLTCCVVLVCAVLRCAVLGRAVLRRAALWCAALCRIASCSAVACCALGFLAVLRCTVVRCGAVCCAASCGAVVQVSLARVVVQSAGRTVAGWWLGGAVRCGCLAASVLWESGCAAQAGGLGRCPWGCRPWGPVPYSSVLWGSRSLALGAVAVPSSSSCACEVALVVAGVVAWR